MCSRTTSVAHHRVCTAASNPKAINHRRNFDITWVSTSKHNGRDDSMSKLSSSKLTKWWHVSVSKYNNRFSIACCLQCHLKALKHVVKALKHVAQSCDHWMGCAFPCLFAVTEADETHAHKSPTEPSAQWQLKQLVHFSILARKLVRMPSKKPNTLCTNCKYLISNSRKVWY